MPSSSAIVGETGIVDAVPTHNRTEARDFEEIANGFPERLRRGAVAASARPVTGAPEGPARRRSPIRLRIRPVANHQPRYWMAWTRIGRSKPLNETSPRSWKARPFPMQSSQSTFDTRLCPGCAWEQRRAAS